MIQTFKERSDVVTVCGCRELAAWMVGPISFEKTFVSS